jgi:hypothetical protein
MMRVLLGLAVVGVLGLGSGAGAQPVPDDRVVQRGPIVTLQFGPFIRQGIPEQDVFVERDGLPSEQVMRVDPDDLRDGMILSKSAYTTSRPGPHDPRKMGPNPLGPFPKGSALGFTLRQWLGATGIGAYAVQDSAAVVDASFRGLIPNGIYTMWCVPAPGRPPGLLPCGALDGSESRFTADAGGNANVNIRTRQLPEGAAIAAAYHSDSRTYGASPGDLGRNAHVHVVIFLPASAVAAR